MSYDIDHIYNFMQHLVRVGVGDRLSSMPLGPDGVDGTTPSVFKVKAAQQSSDRLFGPLPFAVITSQGRDRTNSSISNRYYAANGDDTIITTYDHRFTIGVYGGEAESIAGDLEQWFMLDVPQEYMREQGIVVTDTFGVRPNTTVLQGEAQDFASLNVKLTINNAIVQQVAEMNGLNIGFHLRYPDSDEDIASSTITYPET